MFYAHFVLAKKGPLAKIWLAAHWDKKLTKAHVFETNIEKSVDGILKPKVKMALRTSGHLLLGVVRIYSRKAKYLLADCNEAFVKIKMAFRPGMVDLPEEHREAAMNAITLPEVFHDFDTAMPELNEMEIEAQFSLNQSRAEEITMREDYGSLNLVTQDDGFGDMGFDTDQPDMMRDAIGGEAALQQSNLLFADGSSIELGDKEVTGPAVMGSGDHSGAPISGSVLDRHRHMEAVPHTSMEDGFGGTIGEVEDFGHAGGLFEGDLFGDVGTGAAGSITSQGLSSTRPPQSLQAEIEAAAVAAPATEAAGEAAADVDSDDDDMGGHYDAPSPQHSWDGSQHEDMGLPEHPPDAAAELMPPPSVPRPPSTMPMEVDQPPIVEPSTSQMPPEPAQHDNTTLLQNDEESFALAPVDATILKGLIKAKRKRKLIVDEVKNISGEEMKNQLSNTSDIVTTLDLAPPTRRLMHWKETGGVEKLFALPARQIPSRILFKKYQRNMSLRTEADEGHAEPEHHEPVTRRKRKHQEIAAPVEPEPAPELEPPTPIPHQYEPSVEHPAAGSQTPGYPMTPASDIDPQTPGGMLSLGPPLTPGTLLQGGLTPTGLQHGDMTPGGLQHGGLTPAGLQHGELAHELGGMTPGGLEHGAMTPGGLSHGGLTPAGLGHGGMTPAGLGHGGITPAGLGHGGMTPAGLQHGGMTPAGLQHGGMMHHGGMTPGLHLPGSLGMEGGMTPGRLSHGGPFPGLHHGALTPVGLHHGGMTPAGLHHGMEEMPMMPHLPGDQVSSLLGDAGNVSTTAPAPAELDHTVPLEPLSLHGLADQPSFQNGMQMANLGYDDTHGHHSPTRDDYDLPPSVEHGEEGEREAGETDEQFEERVLNRRAAQLFGVMRPKLQVATSLTFREVAPLHNNRKQAAQKFYSLLVLKKYQVLSLKQEDSYGELIITKGSQFETDSL